MSATLEKLHTHLELLRQQNYDEIYVCFWNGSSLIEKVFWTSLLKRFQGNQVDHVITHTLVVPKKASTVTFDLSGTQGKRCMRVEVYGRSVKEEGRQYLLNLAISFVLTSSFRQHLSV